MMYLVHYLKLTYEKANGSATASAAAAATTK